MSQDLRRLINLVESKLLEGAPLRERDAAVLDWLQAAYDRPDVADLYLHGSPKVFTQFQQPMWEHGGLIFTSKLVGENRWPMETLQAEYYGHNLYLVKLAVGTPFRPARDPKAGDIFREAMAGCQGYDCTRKIDEGHLDYEDCHLFVPPAVTAGYDRFRIYEMSMRTHSHAVAHADMVEIVDRYLGSPPT